MKNSDFTSVSTRFGSVPLCTVVKPHGFSLMLRRAEHSSQLEDSLRNLTMGQEVEALAMDLRSLTNTNNFFVYHLLLKL